MDFINLTKNIVITALFLLGALSCKQNSEKNIIGVVSSATPEASKVGEQIFLKGGSKKKGLICDYFSFLRNEKIGDHFLSPKREIGDQNIVSHKNEKRLFIVSSKQ